MYPKQATSVAVEWRIAGFRIRTFHALFVFIGGFIGAAAIALNAWAGVSLLAIVGLIAFGFAVYVYRNDPELVVSETTLASLLWKGSRNRYSNNENQED